MCGKKTPTIFIFLLLIPPLSHIATSMPASNGIDEIFVTEKTDLTSTDYENFTVTSSKTKLDGVL